MPRSVDELQCLHDQFDFANAADAELDVTLELVPANYITFNAEFDIGDLIEQIGGCALWINERLMLPQEFVRQFAAAGDSARLDQREALPGFAETGIIIFHAL